MGIRLRRRGSRVEEISANQFGQLGILPFTRHPSEPDRERLAVKSEVEMWIENGEPRSVVFIRGKGHE
jgi:hypothetical protein